MGRKLRTDSQRTSMVSEQLLDRGITDPHVLAVMNRVPRERFMPGAYRPEAYTDRALPIDCGQTISQPYIVALMTQSLELQGNERVLEIGAGSGYQAAVLSDLAQSVVTIERHARLARHAAETLALLGYQNVRVVEGDGTQGYLEEAPFDRIVVTAATDQVPPAIWEQLAEGGLMVIPIGGRESQMLQAIRKTNGQPQNRELCPCRFVPLVPNQPLTPSAPKVQ